MLTQAKKMAFVAMAFVAITAVAMPALAADDVAATVNGDKILKKDVMSVLKAMSVKEEDTSKAFPAVVDQMINEKLMVTLDPIARERLLNIGIVGGGPTGVEIAGALLEIKKNMLPKDFPPWQTVYCYFQQWCREGIWEQVLDVLNKKDRLKQGRTATPSYGIIDSQSTKTQYSSDERGIDGGKKG